MAETQHGRMEEIDLIEIWSIIRKYLYQIIVLCLIIVMTVGIITYFFIPKKYESSTIFYIQEKSSSSGIMSALTSQLAGMSGLLPTGVLGSGTNTDLCNEIVMAPSFLRRVLKSQNLPYSWMDVAMLGQRVKVVKKKSGALELSVIWPNPKTAYSLTKRIFTNYKQFVDEQINNSNSDNRKFIQAQYDKAKLRLNKAESALVKYQRAKGILFLPETATKTIDYYIDLEKQKVETDIGLNDARQRLDKAAAILEKKAPQVKANVNEALNPLLATYKAKLAEINVSLATAQLKLTDQHPTVKALLKQKGELEKQIKVENESLNAPDVAGEYMKGLVEVAGLEARKKSLDKVYSSFKDQMGQLPDQMLNYGQLVREQKVAEQVYVMFTAQLEQAKITESKDGNVEILVIDPPTVPYTKKSPSTVLNMTLAGFLTLIIGCGWIIFLEKYGAIFKSKSR